MAGRNVLEHPLHQLLVDVNIGIFAGERVERLRRRAYLRCQVCLHFAGRADTPITSSLEPGP